MTANNRMICGAFGLLMSTALCTMEAHAGEFGFGNDKSARVLFKDNFDKDAVGQFPSDWQLLYDGDGAGDQEVSSAYSVSPQNSLQLVGSSCWAANAYHAVTLEGRRIVLKGDLRVDNYDLGGCTQNVAGLALTDPNSGEWGTYYTGVDFENDGYIHAYSGSSNPSLQAYVKDRWYKITVVVDLARQTSDIYVGAKRVGRNMPFTTNTGVPKGVEIYAGHSSTPPYVYYDNIAVELASGAAR